MKKSNLKQMQQAVERPGRAHERGAALALSLILLALVGVITISTMAVVRHESYIAGGDLQHTQGFYASSAGIEKMTNDFSALFGRTSNPTQAQFDYIAAYSPPELVNEGFVFNQTLTLDNAALTAMRQTQGITNGTFPSVTIPNGPYAGLLAAVAPYRLTSTSTHTPTNTQVRLERNINNYLIPLFQFGMFSNEDIELHPGPPFTFNGRVHANGNVYINGNVTFLDKVTTANELVVDRTRNGIVRTGATLSIAVGGINQPITAGSVSNGPNFPGASLGQRGYFPNSADGTINPTWDATSIAAPQSGRINQFGGQIQTRSTGASPLLLPLQLGGSPTRELIKRALPLFDSSVLTTSRYHNKAQIRILVDDEDAPANMPGGIPAGKGIVLSAPPNPLNPFPMRLPNLPIAAGGGRALWRVSDTGAYIDTAATAIKQGPVGGPLPTPIPTPTPLADTVRSVQPTSAPPATSATPDLVPIPAGAGITGRIYIEIVAPDGSSQDVTREVLSMGMTEGEPNGIVYLQRPLWAAFTQGSRDASGGTNSLVSLLGSSRATTGEVKCDTTAAQPVFAATYLYLTNLLDNTAGVRNNAPPNCTVNNAVTGGQIPWNSVVPINVYNVREGFINSTLTANTIYERGITGVIELNMRNLARWVDGVYDGNLLANTPAVSGNIDGADGYIVYVSDRRGDRPKPEQINGFNYTMTNGMVDNEDIYGPNNLLDGFTVNGILYSGEDVIDAGIDGATGLAKKGTLQHDVNELPDLLQFSGVASTVPLRVQRAIAIAQRKTEAKTLTAPALGFSPNYFRRAVRLFNGENLQITGAANKLSITKGITVASENMVYIWGNYNTTGISSAPPAGVSCLNDATGVCTYTGNQVPTSIVADAFFPLSKTWADSGVAMYPDDVSKRPADLSLPGVTAETAVRAGIVAGNNLSALAGTPDAGNSAANESRLCGGMHNFPRFLESWSQRWNFVGSMIPLYHSTQALGQYNANSTIYGAPIRDWAFDVTFRNPARLPPGTPQFQYIEPTGFRQTF